MATRNQTDRQGDERKWPGSEIDRALIWGELVELPDGAVFTRYPMYSALARQSGWSVEQIGRFSRAHGCLMRRKRVQERIEMRMAQRLRVEWQHIAHLRLIDAYLLAFASMMAENRVLTNDPKVAIQMIQLKLFLRGDMCDNEIVTPLPARTQLQGTYRRIFRRVLSRT